MIHALITLYYPDKSALEHIRRISSQADRVYLCDNTPISEQQELPDLPDHVFYIHFGANLGISQAFNRVLQDRKWNWSKEDCVLFFDQDSQIEEGHIQDLIAVFNALQQEGKPIGCLGPVYFNTSSGSVEIPKIKQTLHADTWSVSSIITSSMLCTYGDLEEIGFWNEAVFLDMADWDLCWRMRAVKKLCCITQKVVLRHSVGVGQKKIGPFTLRVGQPFREYYQIRECLYLLMRTYTPMKYRLRFLAMLLIRSPLHLIFLDQHRLRFKYLCQGIRDFMAGRHGALEIEPAKDLQSV